jgi:hypothetical protein
MIDQDAYGPAPASSAICASASRHRGIAQARSSLVTGHVVHVDHNLR